MKNHLKLKVWAAVFCGGAAILAAFLYTLPTFAAGISKDSIIQKAALTGLHYCYTKGTMRESIEVGKYTGPGYLYSGDGTKKVAMPSGYTDRDTLTCTQILAGVTDKNKGSNAYPGLASTMGSLSTLTTPSAVAGFLGKMGYQKQTVEGDGQSCAVFTYTTTMETGFLWNKKTTTSKNTSTICLNTSRGKITSNKASVSYNRQSDSGSAGSDKSNNGLSFTISNNKVECGFIGNSKTVTVNFQKGDTWQSFYDNLLSSGCAKEEDAYIGSTLGGESTTITQHRDDIANNSAGTSAEFYKFPTGQKETAANSAIKTLSSNAYSSYANLAFNQEEKAILLQGYLEGFYKISNKGCDLSGDTLSLAQGDGYKAARIYDKEAGSFKTCYVKPQAHSGDKVYTWESINHININNSMTFDEVINALNGFTLTTLSDPSALENIVSDTAESEEMSSVTACFESAGALGWIECPVLEAAGNLAGVLYEYIESNFLQMNNDLVNDDGIQNAWAQFRNLTNILFAIMFVVVILAQVTGIGISKL